MRVIGTLRRALRRAGWLRVAYECLLTLFCAFTTLVCYAAYGPWEDLTRLAALALAGLIGTMVAVPLRRLHPMTALALGALISLPTAGTSLVLVVLSTAAGYRARRPRHVVAGFALVLAGCITAATLRFQTGVLFGVLAGITLFCATSVLPAAIAAMIAQRRLLVVTMHQRNLELHREQLLIADRAQSRERNRIAAELHDSLGHRLTLMSLYTGGLAQSLTPAAGAGHASTIVTKPENVANPSNPQTLEALSLLRDSSAQAMSELRQILRVLHQDGVGAGHSLDEVESTVAAARATGTLVELVRTGEPRPLHLLAEHAGFRVVQEGLTNALRHAGGAPIRVEVRFDEEALFVEVRNRPGRPYEGTSTGQGLHGLTERVRLAGGVLSQGLLDGGDFRLGAMLPYRSEVPEPAVGARPMGDFPQDIQQGSRRQRIGLIAVIAALLVTLVSGIGSLVLANATDPLPQNVFESFRVGDPEDRARELLPANSMQVSTNAAGAWCEVYLADLYVQPESGGEVRYEVCFKDGVVESKRQFEDRGE